MRKMTTQEIRTITERAKCGGCGRVTLIWQSWRGLVRCGRCGKDYKPRGAARLERVSHDDYSRLVRKRRAAT